MQYNFKVLTALSDDELKQVVDQAGEGLEASSQIVLQASIRVNTELPDEKVEALRLAVDALITEKLGGDTEVELVSQEY